MFGSNNEPTCDDVAIRCQVRRSEFAANKEFSPPQETVVTMRVWHNLNSSFVDLSSVPIGLPKIPSAGSRAAKSHAKTNGSGNSNSNSNSNSRSDHDSSDGSSQSQQQQRPQSPQHARSDPPKGPQLIFTAIHPIGMDTASSKGNNRNSVFRHTKSVHGDSATQDTAVCLRDILLVETRGADGGDDICTLTTMSHGFFECVFDSTNSKLVMIAFLQNKLPASRFVDPSTRNRNAESVKHQPGSSNASNDGGSFDVEAFTAHRISERIKTETFSERVKRKAGRVLASFEELTSLVSDCMCGCSQDSDSPNQQPRSRGAGGGIDFCGGMMEYDTSNDDRATSVDSPKRPSSSSSKRLNIIPAITLNRYKMKISPILTEEGPTAGPPKNRQPTPQQKRPMPFVLSRPDDDKNAGRIQQQYSQPRLSMEYSQDMNSTI